MTPMLTASDPGRKYRWITAACLTGMLLGSGIGTWVPAGSGWDFANFYDAGRRFAAGEIENLYAPESPIRGEPPQGHMAYWSPPLSAAFLVPLSGFSGETALILFKLQNTLALFATFALLYFFNRRFVRDDPVARWEFAALFSFLCLVYQPFWTVYRVGGQTTPTVVLLLSIALVLHTRSRLFFSSLCWVVAVVLKPAFAAGLAFLGLVSGLRFLGFTALLLAAAAGLSLATLGWSIHETFLSVLLHGAGATFPWFYNSSLYVTAEHLRGFVDAAALETALAVSTVAIQLGVAALCATVLWKARSHRLGAAAARHFRFLLSVIFFLLVSRTVWEHYLAVLFLPLAYIVACRRAFGGPALRLVAAIFAFALGQNLIVVSFLRDQWSFESLPGVLLVCAFKSAPLLLTLLFVWRHHEEWLRSYATRAWTD